MQFGVSLFSYQEQYYRRQLTLDGCLAAAKSAGAAGIEMLADQMVPGYPSITYNLDEAFVTEWQQSLSRYQLDPISFDIYGESKLLKLRPTTEEELAEQLIVLIRTGKALGFKIFRINFLVPLSVIEMLVPHAERMDVLLAIEVHAPHRLSGSWVQGTLEIKERLKTRHLGIMPDFGTFCRRIPGLVLAEARRKGVREDIIELAEDAYHSDASRKTLFDRVEERNGSEEELWLAKRVEIGVWINDDIADLKDLLPHCVHAHGKFYEMTDDLVEPDVRYDEIMPVLRDGGYTGFVMSEYEGQRLNQGTDPGYDEIEQVRRHQKMMRSFVNG